MTTPGIGDTTPRSTIAVEVLGDLMKMIRPAAVDDERAQLVVELAMLRVSAVVSPIPEGARPILLESALRGYLNPSRTSQESAGPFSRTIPDGGVYLTRDERDDLLALAGKVDDDALPGAFTIRPGTR